VLISRYQSRWSHGAHISVVLAAEWHIYILIITVRYVDRKLIGSRWRTMEKLIVIVVIIGIIIVGIGTE
jgi:hypothetical protein